MIRCEEKMVRKTCGKCDGFYEEPMTVYFSPPVQDQTKHQVMAECCDLIMTTADYLETQHYTGGSKNVPLFTNRWLNHLMPRLNAHGIPLTEKMIIGSAYWTLQIRIRFPDCNRTTFYFPIPPKEEELKSDDVIGLFTEKFKLPF
uniref:DUF2199 domain-containing protein n=1 Tax=Caenorhabditis tropicalis TaxID=1561998 RepID=A0A1I7TWR9_9PELO